MYLPETHPTVYFDAKMRGLKKDEAGGEVKREWEVKDHPFCPSSPGDYYVIENRILKDGWKITRLENFEKPAKDDKTGEWAKMKQKLEREMKMTASKELPSERVRKSEKS